MKELTESIIKDSFLKTGIEEEYFPYYETELKRRFKAFREMYPYEEDLDEDEKAESAFNCIATAVARKGNELTPEEKNRLIALILGREN